MSAPNVWEKMTLGAKPPLCKHINTKLIKIYLEICLKIYPSERSVNNV
jgi:hypothetical protein